MPVTFSLTSTGLTTIDFTSATDFVFQDDYYVPVVITPTGDGSIPPYVTETLPVMVNATTDDDLALTLQELAALQKRAAEYWVDQQQAVPVLLNCKLDLETTGRQALVKAIHFEWKPAIHPMYRECSIPPGWMLGTVLIERHPYWERPTVRVFPNVWSTAAAAVAYDYTGWGLQLISNGGFETVAAGPDWANWTEDAGDGALADEGVWVHGGVHAARLTAGASANTIIYQDITVVPNGEYYLTFWARGDVANAGRYQVYDFTHGADIVPVTSTGIIGIVYTVLASTWVAPAGCTTVRILFYCPTTNGGVAYVDDVGVALLLHDIVGDVPARVSALTLYTTATDYLSRFWMGIRSATLHGATGVTGFIPIWECEAGVLNVDTSIYLEAPGGGSGAGNNTVHVDPGFGGSGWDWDAAYINVQSLSAANVGYATYSDCFGRFLWLLRARVTAGTWSVYLRGGLYAAENYFDPITVSNANWDYHELAVCAIPTFDVQGFETTSIVHIPVFWLYAKRLTGAGDLYLDCLCPIPTDEGFLKIYNGRIISGDVYTILGEGPHGHQQVLGITNAATDRARNTAAFEWEHFQLPPGDGRMICVYADSDRSVITDDIEFADGALSASIYYERWTALRGAE